MLHYTQCGLDNVWLENGYDVKTTPYGKAVAIPDVDGLHALLAAQLAKNPGPLTGKEFKFLRGWLGMTQEALAGLMGVTEGALSLWERKDAVPILRLIQRVQNHQRGTEDLRQSQARIAKSQIQAATENRVKRKYEEQRD